MNANAAANEPQVLPLLGRGFSQTREPGDGDLQLPSILERNPHDPPSELDRFRQWMFRCQSNHASRKYAIVTGFNQYFAVPPPRST